jgi:conjugal transfer/entry exclusion protein
VRTLLLSTVAVCAIAMVSCGSAFAQAVVVCPTCSQIANDLKEQIWEGIQWAHNLEQQILQVEQAIQSNIYLLKSTIQFPFRIFDDAAGTIAQIEDAGEELSHFSLHNQFMIGNLGARGGWGGSLDDIPLALAQEDEALSMAMQKLGLVNDQTRDLSRRYTMKLASLEGTPAEGQTQAIQVGNSINATIGQQNAALATQTNATLQALATAELKKADRESMIAAKAQQNRLVAIAASCSQLTTMSPPVCQQQPASGAPGGAPGSSSPGGSYVAVAGSGIPDSAALAINAAPNTP